VPVRPMMWLRKTTNRAWPRRVAEAAVTFGVIRGQRDLEPWVHQGCATRSSPAESAKRPDPQFH
jgi:hypothetical protein